MMWRVKCDDTNGRKFSLIVSDKTRGIDPSVGVTQEFIDQQNASRAKFLGRAAIVAWSVEDV